MVRWATNSQGRVGDEEFRQRGCAVSLRPEDLRATSADRQLFERELASFVPPEVFDAHAHLYRIEDVVEPSDGTQASDTETDVGHAEYLRLTQGWMGERAPSDGVFFRHADNSRRYGCGESLRRCGIG